MLKKLQKGRKGSSKGFRRGKKGWSEGEFRDVLKFSTKEAGKAGRRENYKQVRLKLQSDRLNSGWRDQPAHGTNKGRGRPQLAQVDDVLARTSRFLWRVGASREGLPSEQGTDHKFRDFLQWYGLQRLLHRTSSKRFFVLITPVAFLVLTMTLERTQC